MNMDALIGWYQAQTPRDQKVAAIGAVLLVLGVILAIFVPLDTSVSRAHTRVQHKQSDLAWMQSVLHCTHYITGGGEQAYLRKEDAPEITYVVRDTIDRADEAYAEPPC